MNRKLVSSSRREKYRLALNRLRKCMEYADAFSSALKRKPKKDMATLIRARIEISCSVPQGVCRDGDPEKSGAYFVCGVYRVEGKTDLESIFNVHLEVLDAGGSWTGDWVCVPLLGHDGFMHPITRDGYHGPRYIYDE